MKRITCFLLSILTVVTLTSCGNNGSMATQGNVTEEESLMGVDSATIRFKVGTTTAPSGHYVKGLQKFQDLLEEYSDGEMTVDIYPNSQLGNERDMMENVGMGIQAMALISTGPMPNFIPDFAVLDLPYIFETTEEAYDVLDGKIGRDLLNQLSKQNIIGVNFWENGFRNLTNDKKEILEPNDIKNMKIRTMENKIHMVTYKEIGASPTPIAWGEIFSALQQGTVDGQENPLAIIETAKVYEVQKYVSLIEMFYSPCVLMVNKDIYSDLTKDQQEIFNKAAEEAKVWQREYSKEYNEKAIKIMEEAGVKVSEVDKNLWKESIYGIYEEVKSLGLNEELVNELIK